MNRNFQLQKMDWTCSVKYNLVVHVKKDAFFYISFTLCTIFEICNQILESVIFEKLVKMLSPQNCQLF